MLIGLLFACGANEVVASDPVGARTAGDCPAPREIFCTTGKGNFLFDAWDGPAFKAWYDLPESFNADFNWQLLIVPGSDHDNGKMAIGAAPFIP
jgi:hypothetical protein